MCGATQLNRFLQASRPRVHGPVRAQRGTARLDNRQLPRNMVTPLGILSTGERSVGRMVRVPPSELRG